MGVRPCVVEQIVSAVFVRTALLLCNQNLFLTCSNALHTITGKLIIKYFSVLPTVHSSQACTGLFIVHTGARSQSNTFTVINSKWSICFTEIVHHIHTRDFTSSIFLQVDKLDPLLVNQLINYLYIFYFFIFFYLSTLLLPFTSDGSSRVDKLFIYLFVIIF